MEMRIMKNYDMKYLLGAKHFHSLFESSLQVGNIYILPLFLPNDKNWVSGKLIESDLVHPLWATQQRSMAARGIPGNTTGARTAKQTSS